MKEKVAQVKLSYGRCVVSQNFFDDFYDDFMNSSALIRERFDDTDMVAQKALLRHGLSYLIQHAGDSRAAEMKVARLADSHARDQLDIKPWMYDYWVESLMKTILSHDKKADEQLLLFWKETLRVGIDKMISRH